MKLDFDIENNILEWVSELEHDQCVIIYDSKGSENYKNTVRALVALSEDGLFDRWMDEFIFGLSA